MRPSARSVWLLAFAAVFAALAGYVFWGTWSPDFAPVMPDCAIVHAPSWFSDWWRGWLADGKFSPLDLRIFVGTPWHWQELNYALALFLSGLGLAYFLRGRGLPLPASLGAGLLLAFCGYWCTLFSAGHAGWFFWMAYGVWPFGLADRAVRGGRLRHWLLLGATAGWASFRQADMWLLFAVLTLAYCVFCCLRERRLPWKGALVAAVAALAVGGPGFRGAIVGDLAARDSQIAEGQTVAPGAAADEAEKRWIFVTNWSLPPEETKEFLFPRLNGDTSCPLTLSLGTRYGTGVRPYTGALGRPKGAPSGNYRQHSLYVGRVTLLLALLGLAGAALRLRRGGGRGAPPDVWFFAGAALVCWTFSLGRNCETVYRAVYALPFGDYLRAPVKWHHLTELCACVLAGYGLAALLSLLGRAGGRLARLAPAAVALVALLGACDLARVARVYCAPVDLTEARRQNCSQQLAFLPRGDFARPEVAAMVRAKRIVPQAQPNAGTYLVGVLEPWKRDDTPAPPFGAAAALGALSMLASLAVAVFAVASRLRPRLDLRLA